MSELNHLEQVQAGLVLGNLKHMVDRVSEFKKKKADLAAAGHGRIITKETQRQEVEAAELARFIDFSNFFGEFDKWHSWYYGEPGLLGPMTPFKYDIAEHKDGTTDVKCLNVCLFWPLRIIQQLYGQSKARIILDVR